jgi:2-dehydropantoate 2-reductase
MLLQWSFTIRVCGYIFSLWYQPLFHSSFLRRDMTHSKPRIAIIGAGAVGSLLGGLLAKAGEDVTLVGRQEQVIALNRNKLCICGVLGEFSVKVMAAEHLDFVPDIVLLSVKNQDLEAACAAIAPFVNTNAVVPLLNGVHCDRIVADTLDRTSLVSGIVLFNAQYISPGTVTCAVKAPILLGEAFGITTGLLDRVERLLGKAMDVRRIDNLSGARWTKLLMNCVNNVLDTLSGRPLNDAVKDPILLKIGVLVLREAFAALDKAQIGLVDIPGFPISVLRELVAQPPAGAAKAFGAHMEKKLGNREILSSTLQSIKRGKPTEIEFFNGEIITVGLKVGVSTPCNQKVIELIHSIEKTGKFFAGEELKTMFSEWFAA